MPLFTPPAHATEVPPVDVDSRGPARALFRHYRARPAGRNVYIYSDDTVSEVDPDGSATFCRRDEGSPYVTAFFQGGAGPYTVTAAQETLLEAAGFTVD
jgi:hypothetical protein